jgi:lambda family phage minor tail protein L
MGGVGMTTNTKIKSDIQQLSVGSELVELYVLDATTLGGDIYYFTPMTEGGSNITFNGIEYHQLPVSFTGMEVTGDGRLPRPRMQVANVNLTFVALVNSSNDGVGAKVTRLRTFKKYIDGHAGADANAQFPQDVFYIEQKVTQNKFLIEWELVAPIDIGSKMLPRNQAIAYCQNRYRIYKDGALSYLKATCPYTGPGYFKDDGTPTTAAMDRCGKKLSDCELRYPLKTDQLPFKGFPGVGQVGRAYR